MALDLNQIAKTIQTPSKRQIVAQAERMQNRLRFYSETQISYTETIGPFTEFMDWVQQVLSAKDKFYVFQQLFKLPSPTVDVVENVYRDLARVFDSQNASATYNFTSTELAEDWRSYQQIVLHEPDIWKTKGWKKMQVSPNSVLVVDLAKEQTSSRPEPYFYWLEISDVIDYRLREQSTTDFEWIIFKQPDNKIAVIDDTSYRVFEADVDDWTKLKPIVEAPHDLGYCPARFFWSVSLNESNPDLKKNPITKELSNLQWLLFYLISKRQLDLYGAYPIYATYEASCDFKNNETGDYCDGGFLRGPDGNWKINRDGSLEKCPLCSSKRLTGPGSLIEIPAPDPASGVADMRNPVSITTIDRESLDYNVSEVERLKEEIITSVVGTDGKVSEKEAINTTQVAANFESKTTVLNDLKVNFEEAQKFVDSTICRLRYGSDFLSMSISWGTKFYVYTEAELREKYLKAKSSGASNAELSAIRQEIIDVEYRNNPLQLARMSLLLHLEPYANSTVQEVVNLYDKGLIDKEDFMVKLNFEALIKRFERENIDILEFGKDLKMSKKIEIITKKLKDYVKEQKTIDRGEGQTGSGKNPLNGNQG